MVADTVVRLREEDIVLASHALAEAFQDDPLQTYVFPDARERAERSPAHFEAFVRYGLLYGEVLTTVGAPKGAAVWLGPDAWEITPARATSAGLDRLPAAMGQAAADRFFSVLAAIEPHHHRDVPAAHWYLLVLGVSPAAQGGGIGRALIQPVIDRADAAGQPCYLETAQPNNVPFYKHLGFRQIVETRERASGLQLWTFRRDPPTAA